jgi:hypothetical protein
MLKSVPSGDNMKFTRNMRDPESRRYWESLDRKVEEFERAAPSWLADTSWLDRTARRADADRAAAGQEERGEDGEAE